MLAIPTAEDGFRLERSGGLVLVVPRKGRLMDVRDWPDERRWLRSAVLRDVGGGMGEPVSLGFPKFFNLGEHAGDTALLESELASGGDVRFGVKLDGSLCVRSVVDGAVMLRTRGTLDGGEHGVAMRRIAAERYPALLDPDWQPSRSLLLELVSPDFRIVLAYEREDLVLLGFVDHATLRLATATQRDALATSAGLPAVEDVELPHEIAAAARAVAGWDGREGVVARCAGEQVLVKLKAADYLAKHRLRFALTARLIRELCEHRGVVRTEDFEPVLAELGGDWELAQGARELVDAYVAAVSRANAELATLRQEVADRIAALEAEHGDDRRATRKAFATTWAARLEPALRAAAFMLADGRGEQATAQLRGARLDEAFATASAEDEVRAHELDP